MHGASAWGITLVMHGLAATERKRSNATEIACIHETVNWEISVWSHAMIERFRFRKFPLRARPHPSLEGTHFTLTAWWMFYDIAAKSLLVSRWERKCSVIVRELVTLGYLVIPSAGVFCFSSRKSMFCQLVSVGFIVCGRFPLVLYLLSSIAKLPQCLLLRFKALPKTE